MINLNALEDQDLQALARLAAPGNEALVRVIRGEVENATNKLKTADDTIIIHRLQGRVGAYEDLLTAAKEVVELLGRA